LDIIKGPVIKHKTEYTIYILKQNGDVIYLSDITNNNEIQLSVNLNDILKNFDLQRTDNEDIIYAIVPILNHGETLGSPLFLKTMESNFTVNIPVEVVSNFESIRYLIFPYAGSFNVNFLGSYKAFYGQIQ